MRLCLTHTELNDMEAEFVKLYIMHA